MNEQAPVPQPEQKPDAYLQQHPNAVVDPDRAKIMAYASRVQEGELVKAREKAFEAARNLGNPNYRSQDNRGAEFEAEHQSINAENARALADKQAQSAAAVYDRLQNL